MGRDPVQTATLREPRKVAHGPRVRRIRRHPPVGGPRAATRDGQPAGPRSQDPVRTRLRRTLPGLLGRVALGGTPRVRPRPDAGRRHALDRLPLAAPTVARAGAGGVGGRDTTAERRSSPGIHVVRPSVVQEQLLVSRRGECPRRAGRAGTRAGSPGDCPDRPRRRPWRGARACEGPGARRVPDRRRGAHRRHRGHHRHRSAQSAAGTPPASSTCVLLAKDRTGYANLCRLITTGRLRRPKGESCVTWPEICARADGLIALWGGDRSLLIRDDAPPSVIASMREAFGDRLYAMVTRHRRAEEVREEARVRRHAERAGLPWSRPPRCCTTYRHAATSRTCSPASATASPSPPPAG